MSGDESFKPGDVVVLKSGGPQMTVSGFCRGADSNTIRCMWFDGTTKQHDATFPPETLERAGQSSCHGSTHYRDYHPLKG